MQCGGCYTRFKLTRKERSDLQEVINDIMFTCGAPLQGLEHNKVYTRELSCGEPIEKLYYMAKYSPICIYCADDMDSVPKVSAVLARTRKHSLCVVLCVCAMLPFMVVDVDLHVYYKNVLHIEFLWSCSVMT